MNTEKQMSIFDVLDELDEQQAMAPEPAREDVAPPLLREVEKHRPSLTRLLKPMAAMAESPVTMDDELESSWSDSGIYQLMERMIIHSLEELADDHFSVKYRAEVMQWFDKEAGASSLIPFEDCCAVCGYDADELRYKVQRIWQKSL